jgi:hypothetical protein
MFNNIASDPCRGGHFLKEDIAKFDTLFFSMTAAEGCVDLQMCSRENELV